MSRSITDVFLFVPNYRIIELFSHGVSRKFTEDKNSQIRKFVTNDKSRKFVTKEKSWDRKDSSVILRDLPCEDYNSLIRKFVTRKKKSVTSAIFRVI